MNKKFRRSFTGKWRKPSCAFTILMGQDLPPPLASLIPEGTSGWQQRGKTRELPATHGNRLNVLGFMSLDNDSFFHTVEGRVDSKTVIAAFDAFAAQYEAEYAQSKIPCFVILDNAPVHTSKAFQGKYGDWMSAGICLHFLPTYSPELNLIEILWRKIKYEWLPLDAYRSYKDMVEQLLAVLAEFGKKYTITFG